MDPKHLVETNPLVYVTNQLTVFYMSPANTEGSFIKLI